MARFRSSVFPSAAYNAEIFRMAEEVHKGVDEAYLRKMCRAATNKFKVSYSDVYGAVKSAFYANFAAEGC